MDGRDSERRVVRFLLPLSILAVFADFNTKGFGKAPVALLTFATIYCVAAAVVRREAPFDPSFRLTDEAVAYALVGLVLSRLA